MDEHALARALGWVSIGVGLALVAAPGPLIRAIGLGDRPNLGRFLGVRDLVLGTGLLRGQNTAGWCRARGIADARRGAHHRWGCRRGFPERPSTDRRCYGRELQRPELLARPPTGGVGTSPGERPHAAQLLT